MFDLIVLWAQGASSLVLLLAAYRVISCAEHWEISLRTLAAALVGYSSAHSIAKALYGEIFGLWFVTLSMGAACWVLWLVVSPRHPQGRRKSDYIGL